MDIPEWVLVPFSNTETKDYPKLEEALIEVFTGIKFKVQGKILSVLAAKADSYTSSWVVNCGTNMFISISIILLDFTFTKL